MIELASHTVSVAPISMYEDEQEEVKVEAPLLSSDAQYAAMDLPKPVNGLAAKVKAQHWTPVDSTQHSFIPSIEGLRGVAVTLTTINHVIKRPLVFQEASGNMGVTIFFVLSGFLITGVLMRLEVSKSEMK
jgi:hypothetical protein